MQRVVTYPRISMPSFYFKKIFNMKNLNQFLNEINNLKNIDVNHNTKRHLGEMSIYDQVYPIINDIIEKSKLIETYSENIHQNFIDAIKEDVYSINSVLAQIGREDEPTFIKERNNFLRNIYNYYSTFLKNWVYIQSAIIDSLGIISNSYKNLSEIEKETILQAKNEFEQLKNNTLSEINKAQNQSINLLKERESQLKQRIQRTASKVSVEDAQIQFEDACKKLKLNICIWGVFTIIIVCVFGYLAYFFYYHSFFTEHMKSNLDTFGEKFIEILRWESIYHTIIRIAILTVIGTIIAFCLKMLRANLHLYQHNLHRQRIANSIEAFVNAAITDDQSDRILEKLVESVVAFGQSGLIQNEDDSIHASKLTIDSITKTLNSK